MLWRHIHHEAMSDYKSVHQIGNVKDVVGLALIMLGVTQKRGTRRLTDYSNREDMMAVIYLSLVFPPRYFSICSVLLVFRLLFLLLSPLVSSAYFEMFDR